MSWGVIHVNRPPRSRTRRILPFIIARAIALDLLAALIEEALCVATMLTVRSIPVFMA